MITLALAYLCIDCQCVGSSANQCPKCASREVWPLSEEDLKAEDWSPA